MSEKLPVDELADERIDLPIVSSEVVFEGAIWDVRRETFDYNGDQITREFVDHTGAVSVLAVDDEDRVLLIKQYRHPIRSREWEIPAGLLDVADEDPLEAAKRELAEEVDLSADSWSVLSDYVTTPGGNNEAIRVYLARGVTDTDAFAREDEEADIEKRWVPLDEALDAVVARRVQNPSLVVAVYAAFVARSRGWSTLAPADAPWPQREALRSFRQSS
ncbi:NUDIX domain-containing protein [Agreia sp. Leaf210]|uniref:NUDIX domain-containing protein n=1 Tax=Agreia sp. Leaf210 TaxID=1735682 RepID=UPI0006FBFB8E|nr:NUDIX hydrolase [Agreia sp. Leaf210]KQM58653.1 ADP-ribose pyrophosphatase [Agreia sp. Leaf210]